MLLWLSRGALDGEEGLVAVGEVWSAPVSRTGWSSPVLEDLGCENQAAMLFDCCFRQQLTILGGVANIAA